MEKSYFCAEQVEQMYDTYDAFVMLKIAHDAGIDVKSQEINFFGRYQGEQTNIFWRMVRAIFGESEHTEQRHTEHIHHVKPRLPSNLVNKVGNLATIHDFCHSMIHNSEDYSYLGKPWKKILDFRVKLDT